MIITPSNANPLRESNIVIRLRGDDNGIFLVIANVFKLVMPSQEHFCVFNNYFLTLFSYEGLISNPIS